MHLLVVSGFGVFLASLVELQMDSNPRKKATVRVERRRNTVQMGYSSGQGKPCDICGDIGYAKNIVICSKCQKSREHTYCMHPNLFNVPKSWHCEACRCRSIGLPGTHPSNGHRTYLEKMVQDSFKRQKTWSMGNVSSKIPDVKPATNRPHRNYVPKKVETGKVKFLPSEDVCALSSGAKPKPPPLQGGSNSQVGSFGTNHCHVPKRTAVSSSTKSIPVEDQAYKAATEPRPLTVDRLHTSTLNKQAVKRPQLISGLKSSSQFPFKSSTSENLKGVAVLTKENKKHISEAHHYQINRTGHVVSGVQESRNSENTLSIVGKHAGVAVLTKGNESHISEAHHSQINRTGHVVSGVQESRNSENALSIVGKHAGKVDSLLVKDYVCKEKAVDAVLRTDFQTSNSEVSLKFGDEILPNPPAAMASWRGGFEIDNFTRGLNGEFQAYPPGKVSRKAYLVSKQMPKVLQFTLHHRRDVWPDAFHNDPPSGCDIALYFWADDFCRSKEIYNRLLELIDKEDLSIKSCLDGVELLIFTSKQLPIGSQRMNKQFYLWGVFVSARGHHSSLDWKGKQHAISFPLHPMEKEQCDDLDAPPGFSRSVNTLGFSRSVTNNAMEKEQCDDIDAPPGFSRSVNTHGFSRSVTNNAMEKEQCDDLDAPPGFSRSVNTLGFSRSVTNNAAGEGPVATTPMKISPVAHKVDSELDTPGFSKLPKPKKEGFLG